MNSGVIADQILSRHPHWEDVLREISNTAGPRMYLTELSMRNDIVNLEGVIIRGGQETQASLSDFMIKMEEGMFRHVSLVSSRKESQGALSSEFEITAEVD